MPIIAQSPAHVISPRTSPRNIGRALRYALRPPYFTMLNFSPHPRNMENHSLNVAQGAEHCITERMQGPPHKSLTHPHQKDRETAAKYHKPGVCPICARLRTRQKSFKLPHKPTATGIRRAVCIANFDCGIIGNGKSNNHRDCHRDEELPPFDAHLVCRFQPVHDVRHHKFSEI